MVSSGSRDPIRAEELLEPAGTGLALARRLRHGRLRFRLAGWFTFGSAGFFSALFGLVRFSPARLGSLRLGSVLSDPAIATRSARGCNGTRVPLRVPEATGPRAGAVFTLCIDDGRLVTRLRVPVLVPSRSSSYGKPPLRCLK